VGVAGNRIRLVRPLRPDGGHGDRSLDLLSLSFCPLAWISGGIAARGFGEEDPSVVVIDEVVGQTIALLFVPVSLWYFIGAFALFRFFDITKPPPVRRCERLPGGLGILMDDCVAGIYAGLTILGIRIILHAM
jgi:phosphatidylglycerophosphatase A